MDYLASRDSKEPLTLEIYIKEIQETKYGYQCHFKISKYTEQSQLAEYTGYFYIKAHELNYIFDDVPLSEFNYLTRRYKVTGEFEKNWYPKNPGQTHPLIYLLGQRSFGEFDKNTIELVTNNYVENERLFSIFQQKNSQYRQKIQEKVDNQLSTSFRQIEYGLLKAMILGDKSMIDPDVSYIYSKNGLSHILAISGLHIMIFIGCLEYIFRVFQLPRYYRFWLMFSIAIAYLWLLGFIISAIRAMSMGVILIFTITYDKVYVRDRILFILFCVFLIISPNALFSISFMLSFGAVFGLFYLYPIFKKNYDTIRENILLFFVCDSMNISFSISLVTFPILLYFFRGISLSGFIVNVFVLPVVPIFYVFSIISVLAGFVHPILGRFLAGTSTIVSSYMLAVMHVVDFEYGFLNMSALSLPHILLYYTGLITYVIYKQMKREEYD